MKYVPVLSADGKPLMPCHPARARELVRKGRAVRRFRKGFFYIQLLDRTDGEVQPVACGIDPGSKWEAFSIVGPKHTYLNLHIDAVTHVKENVEKRRMLRRIRRYRKTPNRKPRFNRARVGIPPSTRARWGWKLRITWFLKGLYPISIFVVEDVKAHTKQGKKRWNVSFSPLQIGKQWFYEELRKLSPVVTRSGWETKQFRETFRLHKTSRKSAETFFAHVVDAWVLAASEVGATQPNYTGLIRMVPLRFRRRSLHLENSERRQEKTARRWNELWPSSRCSGPASEVRFLLCRWDDAGPPEPARRADGKKTNSAREDGRSRFSMQCVLAYLESLNGKEGRLSSPDSNPGFPRRRFYEHILLRRRHFVHVAQGLIDRGTAGSG